MPRHIPTELLDEIVAQAMCPGKGACSVCFADISGFSKASHRFRDVAMRRWFTTLWIRKDSDWDSALSFQGLSSCVREINCMDGKASVDVRDLTIFERVRKISFDFQGSTLPAQPTTNQMCNVVRSFPSTITCLQLLNLPRIVPRLLACIAKSFPLLNTLVLDLSEGLITDCCDLCWARSSEIDHSPIPYVYPTVQKLAREYSTALSPLKKLQFLTLGVFLSDEWVADDHKELHMDKDHEHPHDPNATINTSSCAWCEHCEECFTEYGDETRQREEDASKTIAASLPALEVVTWASYFRKRNKDHRASRLWVRRDGADGAVQVQRKRPGNKDPERGSH